MSLRVHTNKRKRALRNFPADDWSTRSAYRKRHEGDRNGFEEMEHCDWTEESVLRLKTNMKESTNAEKVSLCLQPRNWWKVRTCMYDVLTEVRTKKSTNFGVNPRTCPGCEERRERFVLLQLGSQPNIKRSSYLALAPQKSNERAQSGILGRRCHDDRASTATGFTMPHSSELLETWKEVVRRLPLDFARRLGSHRRR